MNNARHEELTAIAVLERRLNDGYLRIEQAKSRGEDVVAWEEFWIELLRQYETAFDELEGIADERK